MTAALGRVAPTLPAAALWRVDPALRPSSTVELTLIVWMQGSWQTNQLSYNPGPIQNYELTYPSIHPIYELLEHEKWLILQIQSCRISMTQGNRIAKRSSSKDLVLIV